MGLGLARHTAEHVRHLSICVGMHDFVAMRWPTRYWFGPMGSAPAPDANRGLTLEGLQQHAKISWS